MKQWSSFRKTMLCMRLPNRNVDLMWTKQRCKRLPRKKWTDLKQLNSLDLHGITKFTSSTVIRITSIPFPRLPHAMAPPGAREVASHGHGHGGGRTASHLCRGTAGGRLINCCGATTGNNFAFCLYNGYVFTLLLYNVIWSCICCFLLGDDCKCVLCFDKH